MLAIVGQEWEDFYGFWDRVIHSKFSKYELVKLVIL